MVADMLEEERRNRMVFVDPEDDAVSYWWPALIVPHNEYVHFCAAMDSDLPPPSPSERLVCYFEDGSYSVVPRGAMVPFVPEGEPFRSYARNYRRFVSDEGVVRALRFWREGLVPEGFKWLRSDTIDEIDILGRARREDDSRPHSHMGRQYERTVSGKKSRKSKSGGLIKKNATVPAGTSKVTVEGSRKNEELPVESAPIAEEASFRISLLKKASPPRFELLAHLVPSAVVNTRR